VHGKYIALILIAAGLAAIFTAWRLEPSASFDNGTFLGVMGLGVGGVALCVIAMLLGIAGIHVPMGTGFR
jgi:hypothetical protein